MNLNDIGIKWKLISVCFTIASIPIIAVSILNYNSAKSQMVHQTEEWLREQMNVILQNTENTHALLEQKLKSDLNVAANLLSSYGRPAVNDHNKLILVNEAREKQVREKVKQDLSLAHLLVYSKGRFVLNAGRKMTVTATDQITKETNELSIGQLSLAGKKLAFSYDVVDEIKTRTGIETATLFQVIPQGLLRISTNVLKLDGTRAVGTYIPKTSPVYQTLMKGDTFFGRAFVVNAWYYTAYEPIFDANRRVIGALYVGVKEKAFVVNDSVEIVDGIKKQLGGTATVFQLKSIEEVDQDELSTHNWPYKQAMVRISTNVVNNEGNRAVGTIVSKPVFDTVMKGNVFYGRAWVVNDWYMTAYQPLKDKNGKICGILYVGVNEKSYQNTLLEKLKTVVLGQSGYIHILNPDGKSFLYKHSNLLNPQGSDGKDIDQQHIQSLIEKVEQKKGNAGEVMYHSFIENGKEQPMITVFAGFPEWNWIIASVVYKEDFTGGLKRIRTIAIVITFLSIIAGSLISYLLAISISKPLNKMVLFIKELSRGNFSRRLPIGGRDETGVISDAINTLVEDLQQAISSINGVMGGVENGDLTGQVTADLKGDLNQLKQKINKSVEMLSLMILEVIRTSETVKVKTDDLMATSDSLSEGTVQQAASLEEITAVMNEMGEQAKEIDGHSEQARILNVNTLREVNNGNEQMRAMIASMNEISKKSSDVSKVINAIEEIAFQTNLLALNAAVEAARAGKFGKGFAVVAEEVRALAGRSSEAAKNSTELIEKSISEIKTGVEHADKTAKVFQSIHERMEELNSLADEISNKSKAQSSRTVEVGAGLDRVNQVVQKNAAISEQTASSTQELRDKVIHLRKMAGKFTINADHTNQESLPEEIPLLSSQSAET